MSNPNLLPSSLADLDQYSQLGRISRIRNLLYAVTAATALSSVACGSNDITPPAPARGSSCVTVHNQEDKIMAGCSFDYKIAQSILNEDQDYYERYGSGKTPENPCIEAEGDGGADAGAEAPEEKIWVYASPGNYRINVKCEEDSNKLAGYINVEIDKDSTSEYSSRIINSLCSDEFKFIADPTNPTVELNNHLAFSSDTWCTNKLRDDELVKIEVVDIELDCTGKEGCNPLDGRALVKGHGIPMQFEEGRPSHLIFTARTDLIPEGEERIVYVLLKYAGASTQQLRVPITIRGNVCGNNIIEYHEECEGSDMKGLTCENLGFDGGDLKCDDCKVSTNNCVTAPSEE